MAPLARQLKGLVTIGASFLAPALNTGLTNSTISRVATNLLSTAEKSWELGTAAEALIELNAQSVSVFGENAFPPPRRLPKTDNLTDVRTMVDDVLAVKPATSKAFIDGQGSVADAASLGTAVLLANWTRVDLTDDSYDIAASQQLDFLLKEAPRSEAGAISHRAEQVQLWSDYIYMVPPFIAYYGALQKDRELLQEAYDQVRLYRDALVDKESGLWKHIALGSWQDDKLWATGNAWAAAGALRVLQALNQSSEAREFKDQQADLTAWIGEITSAAWERQAPSGAIHNVINDPATFTDSAATALLAASTYRLALFTKDSSQVESANKAFEFIKENINEDGWLEGTVDPYTFYEPSKNDIGQYSPEGQAFSLILHSAWRDYTQALKDEKKDEDRVGRN